MGIYSDNFYSWLDRLHAAEKVANDAAEFKENDHPREKEGSGKGGQFAKKPETLAKEDSRDELDPKESPLKEKKGYRAQRDALAKAVTEDGTYDLSTGKPVSYDSGYQVSFQEETTERKGHAAYIDDEEYDRKVEALSKELKANPDLGRFGEPEISFHVESLEKAMEVARRFNQESIYDWSTHGKTYECKANPDFVGIAHYADRDNHVGQNYHEHNKQHT